MGKASEPRIDVMRNVLWEDDSNLRTEDGTGSGEMFEVVCGPGRRRRGQGQWSRDRIQFQRLGHCQITIDLAAA